MSNLDNFIDYSLSSILGRDSIKAERTEDQILDAIDLDDKRKTDRKIQVLCFLYEGYTYFEIAAKLKINERTVRRDVKELRKQYRG
jgi:DNA-binding NarL/FixJ family response regulator